MYTPSVPKLSSPVQRSTEISRVVQLYPQVTSVVDVLDLDGPTPLFQQIAAILRARIADGTYPADKRMPSARAIAEEFGVTRGTAVAALDLLKEEGLVYGVRGRGTFPRARD